MSSEAEPPPIRVEYTSEFKRNLRQLAKRHQRIKTDIQPLLDALEQGVEAAQRGDFPACTSVGVLSEVYAALTWVGAQLRSLP